MRLKRVEFTSIIAVQKIKKFLKLPFLKLEAEELSLSEGGTWTISLLEEGELIKISQVEEGLSFRQMKHLKQNIVLKWLLGFPIKSINDFYLFRNAGSEKLVTLDYKIDYSVINIPRSVMKLFDHNWEVFKDEYEKLFENVKKTVFIEKVKKIILASSEEEVWWPRFILSRMNDI